MANTQTLKPGAPIVMPQAPRTAPAAPHLVHLQCANKFDHTWGTQIATSVGPVNVSPDGEVEVPVDVAAQLLARRPEGEPMFTAKSPADLQAMSDFQLGLAGQSESLSGTAASRLVYIECPSKILERMAVRDPQTDKQVPVDFGEDGIAVVTQHIFEKMRGAFGPYAGTNPDPEAPALYLRGTVGDSDTGGLSAYFDDDADAPRSGPAGVAHVDGQDNILGVEVEDLDHSRPEPQTPPAAKLIEEFNQEAASSGTPTTTDTNTTPPSPSFLDTLKDAIGAPAMASLAASGLDTEAELRGASKEQLQGVKGVGSGKLFSKIWGALHPESSNTQSGPSTDTVAAPSAPATASANTITTDPAT